MDPQGLARNRAAEGAWRPDGKSGIDRHLRTTASSCEPLEQVPVESLPNARIGALLRKRPGAIRSRWSGRILRLRGTRDGCRRDCRRNSGLVERSPGPRRQWSRQDHQGRGAATREGVCRRVHPGSTVGPTEARIALPPVDTPDRHGETLVLQAFGPRMTTRISRMPDAFVPDQGPCRGKRRDVLHTGGEGDGMCPHHRLPDADRRQPVIPDTRGRSGLEGSRTKGPSPDFVVRSVPVFHPDPLHRQHSRRITVSSLPLRSMRGSRMPGSLA